MFDQVPWIVWVLIAVAIIALVVWLALRSRRSVESEPQADHPHTVDPREHTSASEARRMAADPETAEEANAAFADDQSAPRHSETEHLDDKSGDPTFDTPTTVEAPTAQQDDTATEEASEVPDVETAEGPGEPVTGEDARDGVTDPVDAEGLTDVAAEDAPQPDGQQPDTALKDAKGSALAEGPGPRYDYAQDHEADTGIPIASADHQHESEESHESARDHGYGDRVESAGEDEDYEVPRDEQGRRLDPYGNPVED